MGHWAQAAALVGLLALAGQAHAQGRAPGRDLTGAWTNASVTQLTRPANRPLVVSEEEARRMSDSSFWVRSVAAEASGREVNLADRNVATGYNAGWMDPGATVMKVNGEYRASFIVDPVNGQLPLTPEGQAASRAAAARQRAQGPENPEAMSPNDRCLIASRGSGGPGMLNNLYNNSYDIVQTPGHVVIVVEMVHDARIIPVFPTRAAAQAGHRPAALQLWLGDSVGWWEGDTFVVETLNVHPDQGRFGPIFLSDRGRVTERFRRVAADEIFYAFEVEDPVYYTQAWKAEMTLKAMPGRLYEYACHEGNYALEGILAGARAEEQRTAAR